MKFSIIICTHNVFDRLSETLDSILDQTYLDYEVIIIDGASNDGTQAIVKKYEDKFAGKLRWISEKDSGIYNAMNKGVKMATGRLLNIIGAGDWLEKDALWQASKCLEKYPMADAVYGTTRFWDKDKKTNCLVRTSPEDLPHQPMQHPSIFYKKSLHNKFGLYNERYEIAADYDFCLKAFYLGQANAESFDAVVDNFVRDGISHIRKKECFKETMQIRREARTQIKEKFLELLKKRNRGLVVELEAIYASCKWKFLQIIYGICNKITPKGRFEMKIGKKDELLIMDIDEIEKIDERNNKLAAELESIRAYAGWRFLQIPESFFRKLF
ncbi:MAG: Glycosyltransferase [uncultured bacterium]|nr:MAG: Glycosyltransferase [uncultured bacterium]